MTAAQGSSRPTARFESPFDAIERLLEQPWSDGLPVMPPTTERVDAMIEAGGRDGDAIVGEIPSRQRALTVWQAAACAVMAGCRPEYFPVVLATWDALFDPRFNLHSALTSSGGAAIAAVVSGPYAERIGMNGGTGVFGPGCRANATIGRAIRLGALSALEAVPGELDAGAFGHGGKYSFHFAERPPPQGWPTVREQLGFAADATTVTVMPADAPRQVMHRWSPTPHGMLRTLGAAMRDPTQNATGCGSTYIVALGPEHTTLLAEAGMTPASIREALSETSRLERSALAAAGIELDRAPNHYSALDAEGRMLTARPEHILVVTAGGHGSGWSSVIPCYTTLVSCHPVTRAVHVPGAPARVPIGATALDFR